MNVQLRPTTVYLEDFRPEAEAAALSWAHGRTRSLAPFLTWCIRQVVRLEFLSPANREFVSGLAPEASQALALVDRLVTRARGESEAKVLDPFFAVNNEIKGIDPRQLAIDFAPKKIEPVRAKGAAANG